MPLGTSATIPSPACTPRARSACTIWFTRRNRSPALCSVPSGSTTASQSGFACARAQNPTKASDRRQALTVAAMRENPKRRNSDGRVLVLVLVLVLLIIVAHASEHQTDYQQDDAYQPGDDRNDGGGKRNLEAVVVVSLDGLGDASGRRLEVRAKQHEKGRARGVLEHILRVAFDGDRATGHRVDVVSLVRAVELRHRHLGGL